MSIITEILKYLISIQILFLILFFSLWLFHKNRRLRLILLSILLPLIFIVFISPLPILISEWWEKEYPPFDINSVSTDTKNLHIIVLGAGYTNNPVFPTLSQLGRSVSLRLMEAIRIYKSIEGAKIITSGAAINTDRSQAEAVADAAVTLGVSPKDTLRLSNTLNTRGEAEAYSIRFNKSSMNNDSECTIVLVTSAFHMRRAQYWFKSYGVNTIPAPCDYLYMEDPENPGSGWEPSWHKSILIDNVLQEAAGILWGMIISRTR